MTVSSFADKLDEVAGKVGTVSAEEVAAMLRRAAVIIRTKPVVLNDEAEAALVVFARDLKLSRHDAVVVLASEALIASGYMAYYDFYEEFEHGE